MRTDYQYGAGIIFLVGLSLGAKDCCIKNVCPEGEQLALSYNKIRQAHYRVDGKAPGVCSPTDGTEFMLQPGRLYLFVSQGQVRIAFNLVSGSQGNGQPAPDSFPAPGISRHALIFNLGSGKYRLGAYPGGFGYTNTFPEGGATGPGIEKGRYEFNIKEPTPLCFRVNDDKIDDNDGAFDVEVHEFERTLTCSKVEIGTATPNPGSAVSAPACTHDTNEPCEVITPAECQPGFEVRGRQRCQGGSLHCVARVNEEYCTNPDTKCGLGAASPCTGSASCIPNTACRPFGQFGLQNTCLPIAGCTVPACWTPNQLGSLIGCTLEHPELEAKCGDGMVIPPVEECDPPGSTDIFGCKCLDGCKKDKTLAACK